MSTKNRYLPPEYLFDIDKQVDIIDYLQKRDADDNFFMVEFGHDAIPVAYQQTAPFYGNRAYLGVETWMRNPASNKPAMVQKTHTEQAKGQNIFYTTLSLDGSMRREDGESWFEGTYNPVTALPDGSASEVFLSNVFGDPHIAFSRDFTKSLLAEIARISQETGMIVLRETLTPHNVRHIDPELLAELNVRVVAMVNPLDKPWQDLERVFQGEPSDMPVKDTSCYMFLCKKSEDS